MASAICLLGAKLEMLACWSASLLDLGVLIGLLQGQVRRQLPLGLLTAKGSFPADWLRVIETSPAKAAVGTARARARAPMDRVVASLFVRRLLLVAIACFFSCVRLLSSAPSPGALAVRCAGVIEKPPKSLAPAAGLSAPRPGGWA